MKVLYMKCPIIGCESPSIKTYGGLTMANRIDDHLMREHTMEQIVDYARREIMNRNKKRMDNES